MEVYFVIAQPIGKPKKFKLNDGEYVIIGRDRNVCQVPLADDMCSTKHAKVSYTNHCLYVEDMGSKNGIFLNGVKIVKQRIYKDDKIKLGDSVMYINTEKLSEEELTYLTYQGQSSRQNQGFTLELVNKKSKDRSRKDITTSDLVMSRKKAGKERLQGRRSSYIKNDGTQTKISKEKLKVLDAIASGIDLIISIVIFFALIFGVKILKADDYYRLSKEYSGIDIFLADDMAFFTLLCVVGAVFSFTRNRNNSSGSIGEKILGIN